jgi:hypothetical protein
MPEPLPESKTRCEYFLAYYVPSALRETRVAIGLVLLEETGRLVGHRFTEDWRAVRCLDPQADVNLLSLVSAQFQDLAEEAAAASFDSGSSPENFSETLRRMKLDFAGSLQLSAPRGVLTHNPEQELERLFAQYVAPRRAARPPAELRSGTRPWVRAQLAEAVRRHGLWERFERDVSVEQFTAPGDGFRIDFRIRPNGVVAYLHALSLERDWTQAKLLGYTYWRIRETIDARLTAVVADADPGLPAVRSCRRILTEAQIAVEPLSRVDALLDTMRREF